MHAASEPTETMMAGQIPLPVPSKMTEPFWAGMRQNKLLLQRCKACNAYRWTPQVLCRDCYSEDYEWSEVSGKGTVFSYTVVHRPPLPAFKAPYIVAVIELAEGPLMLTNVIDCDPAALKVGDKVKVAFEKATDEVTLYRFRLA